MPEWNKTVEVVERQLEAMASDVFEVGLFKPDAPEGAAIMVPRVWDTASLLKSIPWLRHENSDGRHIYVRPHGEHHLSLIDDLTPEAVRTMKREGFGPALVVETSPGNLQAWLRHADTLDRETSTAAARALAHRFGGDTGAADWRHYGRLSGFTNRKAKYRHPITGLHPFVRLVEASGDVFSEAPRFIENIREQIEARHCEEAEWGAGRIFIESLAPRDRKSIDAFRGDPRYGGDGTRIDLAYAVYALSHGRSEAEVEAAIRSRDLTHKGNERRQQDYVVRTIKKALAATDRSR